MLEQKADREDLIEPLEQLTHAIERLHGVSLRRGRRRLKSTCVDDAGDYPGS